ARSRPPRAVRTFPTRRSSDLAWSRLEARHDLVDAIQFEHEVLERAPGSAVAADGRRRQRAARPQLGPRLQEAGDMLFLEVPRCRSEEHTSELQSRENLVCRLL